jgi:DNA-binding CsgD family transcriptional regulator
MGRSPNTVHVHVRNIYRKLAIQTRRELLEYSGILSMVVSED